MDINEPFPMKPEGDNLLDRVVSTTNLRYFRTFYTAYSNRVPEIRHIACGEFKASEKRHTQSGVLDAMALAVEEAGPSEGSRPIWAGHIHDEAQEAQVEAQVAIAAIAMSRTCLQRNFVYVE